MKKTAIILLMVCLVLGSFSNAFAEDLRDEPRRNVERSYKQERLFEIKGTIADELIYLCMIKDLAYNPESRELYLLTPSICESPSYERDNQYVFDLDGNVIGTPQYPVISDGIVRLSLEFDKGNVYSTEFDFDADTETSATRVYDLVANQDLGSLDISSERGQIAVSGNKIAYHTNKEGSNYVDKSNKEPMEYTPNFYIGILSPYTTSAGAVEVYSETGQVKAFDFTPDGKSFVYGTKECGENSEDPKFMIRTVDAESGVLLDEFTFDNAIEGESEKKVIESLYVTENYIVVLTRFYGEEKGAIQRFTLDGELIDSVITNYHTKQVTEGPNGSTIYIEKRFDNENEGYEGYDESCVGHFEVVQVDWNARNPFETGRPKAIISEKTVGGKTLAEFKDTGFGLMKVIDPETGAMDYKAPLKSDKNDVRLRIPFADMKVKLAEGANHLLINYKGQEIAIPMSAFDCTDLLAGMPCEDDATIEIHLLVDETGNVTVTVQLFVVEQVDGMTKVVHRKTIQY